MVRKIDKKKLDEIKDSSFKSPANFVSAADRWLRQNGIITPVLHNNIIIMLYVHFPKAKFIEYYMDPEDKEIEIHFHLPKYTHLITRESSLERKAKKLLTQYIPDFRVRAKKRRFVEDQDDT